MKKAKERKKKKETAPWNTIIRVHHWERNKQKQDYSVGLKRLICEIRATCNPSTITNFYLSFVFSVSFNVEYHLGEYGIIV